MYFNMKRKLLKIVTLLTLPVFIAGCFTSRHYERRLSYLEENGVGVRLQLPQSNTVADRREIVQTHKDTVVCQDFEGRKVIIMKAVRDESTGEMVASDVIEAAVVTARFRNVAERHGKVDLQFRIIVPKELRHSNWQLRFRPDLFVLKDSVRLDSVIVTGEGYRRRQLRGYQQYERFLSRIVTDSTRFVDVEQLEFFLQRNIPQVYAFKCDSSYVSDEQFFSFFGIDEQSAVDHYTDHFAKWRNERRKMLRGRMYERYVKVPIVTDGIRLDTVIVEPDGDFIYDYTQTINARPSLRKAEIVLGGAIFEQERQIYDIPRSEPLTFYISSVSSFVEERAMFLKKVVERRVEAGSSYNILFEPASVDVNLSLGNNGAQMDDIYGRLLELMEDEVFDLDSIVVLASSSPEGSERVNDALSRGRSSSVASFLLSYMERCIDSLELESGIVAELDGGYRKRRYSKVPFSSYSAGENWALLDSLVQVDTVLTTEQKRIYELSSTLKDNDRREQALRGETFYGYLKQKLYPELRRVHFGFHLHRKGMVKDTVTTFEPDTCYSSGIRAIRERDYVRAALLLEPYQDFNTAIAYICLDRNVSALNILEGLESRPEINYMKAILHSRLGDDEKAVKCYLDACREESSYIHRGNLDPEISELVRMYNLNTYTNDEQ